MARFQGIIFNGRELPSYVRVKGIKHKLLPTISQNTLEVGGRVGVYDFGNKVGVREISVDIIIVMEEDNLLPQYLEDLAEWCYFEEAKPLYLGDNPNRYYLAKVSGDMDFSEELNVATGTIQFTCTDPHIYGESKLITQSSYNGGNISCHNLGNVATQPVIDITLKDSISSLSVITDDDIVDFGEPYTTDTSKTLVDGSPYILNEEMNDISGWIVPTGTVDGAISGEFEVYDNNAFRQKGLDFGSGTDWHGAALTKNFTSSATNFTARLGFYFNNSSRTGVLGSIKIVKAVVLRKTKSFKGTVTKTAKVGEVYNVVDITKGWYKLQNGSWVTVNPVYSTITYTTEGINCMGKFNIALQDTEGNNVFRFTMGDAWQGASKVFIQGRIGNASSNRLILDKYIHTNHQVTEGYVSVTRNNNKWTVNVYAFVGDNASTLIASSTYTDTSKAYAKPISKVHINTLAYRDYSPSYMEISDLKVSAQDVKMSSTSLPIIARKGDKISIDCEDGTITKNGLPFYKYINPLSTFPKFEKGYNLIRVQPHSAISQLSIEYLEKSL